MVLVLGKVVKIQKSLDLVDKIVIMPLLQLCAGFSVFALSVSESHRVVYLLSALGDLGTIWVSTLPMAEQWRTYVILLQF